MLQDGYLKLNLSGVFILGILMFMISFFIYVYLISKNDLGYIVPILTAFVYISVFTASYFVFNEIFTPIKITAILLILMGVIVLSINK